MTRSPSLVAQIALPNVPAPENVTKATALESRAAAEGPLFPAELERWLGEVRAAREAMQAAVAQEEDAPTTAKAERTELGDSWGCFHGLVVAHAQLPRHRFPARKAAAQAIFDGVFAARGLSWLAGTTHEEVFGRSSSLLEELEAEPLVTSLATLGAPEFVESLRVCQQAFGVAAGILEARDDPETAKLLDQLRDAMRRYIGKVMAWALDGPEQDEVATRLLEPWTTWTEHPSGSGAPPASGTGAEELGGPPPPAPTPPSAPPLHPEDNPFVEEDEDELP